MPDAKPRTPTAETVYVKAEASRLLAKLRRFEAEAAEMPEAHRQYVEARLRHRREHAERAWRLADYAETLPLEDADA